MWSYISFLKRSSLFLSNDIYEKVMISMPACKLINFTDRKLERTGIEFIHHFALANVG